MGCRSRIGAPGLDIAYKLCAYGGRGRLKLSTGKPVLPGRKQVFRIEEDGRAVGDVIARAEEALPGRPLLHPVMRSGCRLPEGTVDLDATRVRAEAAATPGNLAVITHGLVIYSLALRHLAIPGGEPEMRLPNTALALIEPAPPFRVKLWGCIAHLEEAGEGAAV